MRKRPSELECFVLGVVWQLGPCSAYDVRRHMARSPSTQWSASAGAIYPLMSRLERRRLLKARDETTGRRRRRTYVITPAGRAALRAWIGPPLWPEAITVAYDPLRSRARFLGLLPAAERQAWVKAAGEALDLVAERVRGWQGRYGDRDPFLALMTDSGERDIESRRQWLRDVEQAVRSGGSAPPTRSARTPAAPPRRRSARPSPGRGG